MQAEAIAAFEALSHDRTHGRQVVRDNLKRQAVMRRERAARLIAEGAAVIVAKHARGRGAEAH